MTHRELDRIRLVTDHFRDLQGLRNLPIWAWFVVLGCAQLLHSISFDLVSLSYALVAFFLLPRRIERYYRERFGEVERRPTEHPRSDYLMAGGLALVALLLFFLWRPYVFGRLWYAAMGSALLGQWLWHGHHPSQGYWALFGVFSLSLTVVAALAFPALARQAVVEIVIGTLGMLSSLLDHRQLALAMRPPRPDPAEEAARAREGEP
jgi:hypothetical protein